MPKHGDYRHGWQFMYGCYRMIRKHCGIQMFFQHLHRFLDKKLIEAGAPDGVRTNATNIQSRSNLGDTPVGGRWEYQHACRLNQIAALRQFNFCHKFEEKVGGEN